MKIHSFSEIHEAITKGPIGQEKIERLTRTAQDLAESLALMAKRQRPYEVPISSDENVVRFGLIGDTQIGSLYQRLDALAAFYRHCYNEGIEYVLNAGDVLDGWRVYRGQEFELHPNGRSWPEQKKMFAEAAPRYDGLTTIFITGNHDASFKKLIGLVVGEELSAARPDWKFIGQDVGDVTLKTKGGQRFTVRLIHPGGGTAYAVSYHAQKIIESIAGGQKPDLIGIGHYHKAEWLPSYRNVHAVQVGCFQSQTPYMVQRSLAAHVGGWVIKATLGERKKLTSRVAAEFIGFYEEARP
jgi:hypothetical protein